MFVRRFFMSRLHILLLLLLRLKLLLLSRAPPGRINLILAIIIPYKRGFCKIGLDKIIYLLHGDNRMVLLGNW